MLNEQRMRKLLADVFEAWLKIGAEELHESQTQWPHRRQWWRRLRIVNPQWQRMHLTALASATHSGQDPT